MTQILATLFLYWLLLGTTAAITLSTFFKGTTR